jgi:hypothetical protein
MADWTTLEGARLFTEGVTSSRYVAITAGSANVKGSWTAIATSITDGGDGFIICLTFCSTAFVDLLVDIGIGGAGSETVIIPNLLITTGGGSGGVVPGAKVFIPLPLLAGDRLSARCQSTTGAVTIRIGLTTMQLALGQSSGLARVAAYGPNTADSGGTSIDPGGSANTKGAWTQITASTSSDHTGFFLAFGNQANSLRTDCTWLVDIGAGSGGSEVVLLADVPLSGSAGMDWVTPTFWPFLALGIPAGTRLAARASCSITDATDRLIDIALYGVS